MIRSAWRRLFVYSAAMPLCAAALRTQRATACSGCFHWTPALQTTSDCIGRCAKQNLDRSAKSCPMRTSPPALAPRLQHKHVPEQILPIAPPIEMLLPIAAHHRVVEQSCVAEPLLVQQ